MLTGTVVDGLQGSCPVKGNCSGSDMELVYIAVSIDSANEGLRTGTGFAVSIAMLVLGLG